MPTRSVVRTGLPTAVNTDTAMLTQDDSTAAPLENVPTTYDGEAVEANSQVYVGAVEVLFATDGAAVGAAAYAVRCESLGGELQRFLGGTTGGQNATGENTTSAPAFYRTKIPCVAGKQYRTICQMLVTDSGSAVVTIVLHFTNEDPWPEVTETLTDYRAGSVTAITSPTQLQTRDQSTTDGGFAITSGWERCKFVHGSASSTSGVVGSTTCTATIRDNGVKDTQRYGLAGNGGTLATSSSTALEARSREVSFQTVPNQSANVFATMNATDIGATTAAVALTLIKGGSK